MKISGWLLLIAGFLVAAFATALDVQAVNWQLFGLAAFACIVGVFILKRLERGHATSDSVLEVNRNELIESINNVVNDTKALIAQTSLRGIGLRDEIDLRLREDLRRFADARESMVHLYGLQTYADIMSNFAAGERYINRVWSASADGYESEAATYLEKAAGQFAEAQTQLSKVA